MMYAGRIAFLFQLSDAILHVLEIRTMCLMSVRKRFTPAVHNKAFGLTRYAHSARVVNANPPYR
jgi:hypothetical protein